MQDLNSNLRARLVELLVAIGDGKADGSAIDQALLLGPTQEPKPR